MRPLQRPTQLHPAIPSSLGAAAVEDDEGDRTLYEAPGRRGLSGHSDTSAHLELARNRLLNDAVRDVHLVMRDIRHKNAAELAGLLRERLDAETEEFRQQ